MKLPYESKIWNKEIQEISKHLSVTPYEQTLVDYAIKPLRFHPYDYCSFYHFLSNHYRTLAHHANILYKNIEETAGYLYLSVLAAKKSFDYFEKGYAIHNTAIKEKIEEKIYFNIFSFMAMSVNNYELALYFSEEDTIWGCLLRKNYKEAERLIAKLPDNYDDPRNVYRIEPEFLKEIYRAIFDKNERRFNDALSKRIQKIRNVPLGYSTYIDIVSISLIRIAREFGISYTLDVVEIPSAFLDDSFHIDATQWILPDLDKLAKEEKIERISYNFDAVLRGKPFVAKIMCVESIEKFQVYLVIFNEQEEIYRKLIKDMQPNDPARWSMFGNLKWKRKNLVVLYRYDPSQYIEIEIPNL